MRIDTAYHRFRCLFCRFSISHIPYQQTLPPQVASYPLADLVNQPLQLRVAVVSRADIPHPALRGEVKAVQKQQVEVNVYIQGATARQYCFANQGQLSL